MKRKSILMGIIVACALTTTTVGAKTNHIHGTLSWRNPFYAAPEAKMEASGYTNIYAKCSASKSGYRTKSTTSFSDGKRGENIYTDTCWISGPTWEARGTKFTGTCRGYNSAGAYETVSIRHKY